MKLVLIYGAIDVFSFLNKCLDSFQLSSLFNSIIIKLVLIKTFLVMHNDHPNLIVIDRFHNLLLIKLTWRVRSSNHATIEHSNF